MVTRAIELARFSSDPQNVGYVTCGCCNGSMLKENKRKHVQNSLCGQELIGRVNENFKKALIQLENRHHLDGIEPQQQDVEEAPTCQDVVIEDKEDYNGCDYQDAMDEDGVESEDMEYDPEQELETFPTAQNSFKRVLS